MSNETVDVNQKNAAIMDIRTRKGEQFPIHADGKYGPECLPDLILPAVADDAQVVIGSRVREKLNPLQVHMDRSPLYSWLSAPL